MSALAPKINIRSSKQRKPVSKGALFRAQKDLNTMTKVDEKTKKRGKSILHFQTNQRAHKIFLQIYDNLAVELLKFDLERQEVT